MKFLTELMKIKRLYNQEQNNSSGELSSYDAQSANIDEFGSREDGLDGLEGTPDEIPEDQQDPNKAGVIRYVKGAHLVYKRELSDGTYEEMWVYNSGDFKKDMEIKKTITAGTDIPANAARSPDGSQELTMWSAGNADIIVITGLPQ